MKLQYLGTGAAEGVPALFCQCENCARSRALGGRNLRSRSQALVDDRLLIDFPADTYMHFLVHSIPMYALRSLLITHSHGDHLYPADLEMRKDFLSHRVDKVTPLTVYAGETGHNLIGAEIARHDILPQEVTNVRIEPFVPFETEGYRVLPLRASHGADSSPVVYLVEKEGKSLFYSNDTGIYPQETWDALGKLGKPLNLVSLDCTEALSHSTYNGHLDIWRCDQVRARLKQMGAADENTIFVLNHFSHNGTGCVYDDFSQIAAEMGFLTSYDGMTIEF